MQKQFKILKQLNKHKNETFIISDNGEISYHLLYKIILLQFTIFEKNKIKKNDYVCIAGSNSPEYVVIFLSLIFYGAIAVPIDHCLPIKTMNKILTGLKCTYLYYDAANINLKNLHEDILSYPLNEVDITEKGSVSLQKDIFPINAEKICNILFTSGSTDTPKGVIHSINNHIYSALGSNLNIEFQTGDRWLLSLPLFHVGGIAILFRALVSGGTVVIPKNRKISLTALKKFCVTHLSLVPTQLYRLIGLIDDSDESLDLKSLLIGGDRVNRPLFDKAMKLKLPLFLSYGSTEMSSQITATKCMDEKNNVISYGKPLMHRELMISSSGNVLVKGQTLFNGYIDELGIAQKFDREEWFNTGDIGRIDDSGNLIILGRKDNMLILGGENICPEEIESCLEKINLVQKAVVVPITDFEFGCIAVAFVQTDCTTKIDKGSFDLILKQSLPKYKWPKYYFKFPNSSNSLKINRKELQQLAVELISEYTKKFK